MKRNCNLSLIRIRNRKDLKMAIKKGIYTTYLGKEYRVLRRDGFARLISNDPKDIADGFLEREPEKNLNPRIFFKMVSPSEIGDVYEISTFCLYHGFEFHITYDDGENYVLVSDYSPLVEKFNFTRIDKFGYEKTVPKDEVDLVYEKKELITDFFD